MTAPIALILPPGVTNRLSEKTVELNLPRQLSAYFPDAYWFGLTQAQEAANGYDAAATLSGRMVLFQYKVSTVVRSGGVRQFHLPHRQLERLTAQVNVARRVFYVLPDVGTVPEMAASSWDLLSCTWFVDVADIPSPIPDPLTKSGTVRRSGIHYVDLHAAMPAHVVIRSEPVRVRAMSPSVLFGEDVQLALARGPLPEQDPILRHFWEIRAALGRHAFGVIIPWATASSPEALPAG